MREKVKRKVRRRVRKDQGNKEVAVLGRNHAGTLMEKRGACGDANAQHTTGEQSRMSASTVEVPFTAQPTVEDRRSRERKRAKARMRKVKEKEKEKRVESTEERQAGKASHSGDKEAGKETAKEAREEKRMERATKSRTQ